MGLVGFGIEFGIDVSDSEVDFVLHLEPVYEIVVVVLFVIWVVVFGERVSEEWSKSVGLNWRSGIGSVWVEVVGSSDVNVVGGTIGGIAEDVIG